MVEARDITKRYGPFTAVDQIAFTAEKGRILGFIGPNGAGKTTTMRILTGFIPATEGTAVVAGYDVFDSPREVKKRVGYLPETPPLYKELTVGDYLGFVAELRGVPRSERFQRIGGVMERVGLRGWERRILGSLSKGYRQRVGLAQALVHNPEVLILDEPTSGLDPSQMIGVRELIASLAGDHTVILSTHILREVETLCHDVVVINKGKIAAKGTLEAVRAESAPPHYRAHIEAPEPSQIAAAVGALDEVDQVVPLDDGSLRIDASVDPRPAIARLAVAREWDLRTLERRVPSLEDAFIAIVGREGGA